MVNYQNGKIYRLVCNATGKQYVGSTTQPLCKRLHGHVKDNKYWKESKAAYVSSFDILESKNYDVVLVEDYPCETKEQLHSRERYWIERTECVNKYLPTRTTKEWYVEHREEQLRKYKQDYQDNKEERLAYAKSYRDENRGRIQVWDAARYQREKVKVTCECGVEVTKHNLTKHRQTKKHQAYEETLKTN